MLLTGSKAAAFHYVDARKGNLFDVWTTERLFQKYIDNNKQLSSIFVNKLNRNNVIIKYHETIIFVSIFNSNAPESSIIELNKNKFTLTIPGIGCVDVATPDTLYFIKKTHINTPVEWHKHIKDLHFLKGKLSEKVIKENTRPCFKKIYSSLMESDKKSGSMLVPNNDFFNNFTHSYIRIYPHDSLHKVTCYYDYPLYIKLKDDTSLAYVHKTKFNLFTHIEKIRLVREEVYALALERIIIPFREVQATFSIDYAFQYALRKICTDATKGWFRDFAVENYPEIVDYDLNYYQMFQKAVSNSDISKERSDDYVYLNKNKFRKYVNKVLLSNEGACLTNHMDKYSDIN